MFIYSSTFLWLPLSRTCRKIALSSWCFPTTRVPTTLLTKRFGSGGSFVTWNHFQLELLVLAVQHYCPWVEAAENDVLCAKASTKFSVILAINTLPELQLAIGYFISIYLRNPYTWWVQSHGSCWKSLTHFAFSVSYVSDERFLMHLWISRQQCFCVWHLVMPATTSIFGECSLFDLILG